jgi:quercetin dioxygenase-like cupin family protein
MSAIALFWRVMTVAAIALPTSAIAQQADPAFVVTPVAEQTVRSLPPGPLYWRIERFANTAQARADAQPEALFVTDTDVIWRFTLATGKVSKPGASVVQIGPVLAPEASEYLLRINRAGGPPGVKTPVHTHPGSEAFYVLSGALCQRTGHGTIRLDAGQSMNGHAPEMTMQLSSCGVTTLDQFVLFVVDARKPFSTPAQFK